jgi:hypothetical protein
MPICGLELAAKDLAGKLRHRRRVHRTVVVQFLMKQTGHVLRAEMDRRSHQVAGLVARELDDVFSQVRLGHLDPELLEPGVQVDLLGGHRLALDDSADVVLPGDVADHLAGGGGGVGKVDVDAGGGEIIGELPEIMLQVRQDVVADPDGQVPHAVEVGEVLADFDAGEKLVKGGLGQLLAEGRVGRRVGGAGEECFFILFHHKFRDRATSSARCMAWSGFPIRLA